MKKVFIVLAALLMAAPAMASKSRVSSLQGATFLVDSQTIFTNPAHINANGQYLTLEMGSTSNTGNPKAEGGIFRKESDLVYGVYLGHIDNFQVLRTAESVPVQENPVEVFFGKNNWGASVGISQGNKKTVSEKETTLLGRFGMDNGDTEFYGTMEVISKSENATSEYEGQIPTLTGGFEMDAGRFYFGGELTYGKYEVTTPPASAADTTVTGVTLSAIDRSLKTTDRELYYGVLLNWAERKNTAGKISEMTLPLVIGLEANINTWATFRGSVKQNVLLGSEKDGTAAAPANGADTISNDTTVAIGVGLFTGPFTLDGSVAASANGNINGNQVLSNASVTYRF